MKRSVHLVAALAVLGLAAPQAFARKPSAAASQQDDREVQGRALFARGDYQAALDIYVTLFAEKGDAIYLRNIGRCYQKLEQPDKAINSFREYLRRGHLKPAERSEVEGFIQEMEQLRKRQQAAAAAQPPADSAHAAAHSSESATTPPVSTTPSAPPPVVTNEAPGAVLSQQVAPAPTESSSITGRWWFWTGVAAVVVGGAAAVFAATYRLPGNVPPCTNGGGTVCSLH
jgi:tetratricopeptide (TPR) repeat protein